VREGEYNRVGDVCGRETGIERLQSGESGGLGKQENGREGLV